MRENFTMQRVNVHPMVEKPRWGIRVAALLLLVIIYAPGTACASDGGYSVGVTPLPGGSVIEGDADRAISFWQLPLWIQVAYVGGLIASLTIAIKLIPFLLVKIRRVRDNRNRESIYGYVRDNPGSTVKDVSRSLSLNLGTVRYHVDRLEVARRIVLFRAGKFTRLFRNAGTRTDREIHVISVARIGTNQAILRLLRDRPGLSNTEISEELGLKGSQTYRYLYGMTRDGMVRSERDGKEKIYFLAEDGKKSSQRTTCITTVIIYLHEPY